MARDADADPLGLQAQVRAGCERLPRHAPGSRRAARLRVDEVVPRLDRARGAPNRRAAVRDRGASAGCPAAREPVRRGRCSRRGAGGRAHARGVLVGRAAQDEERRMRVLIVSGIWPPDVGGPASHAPEVAGWLRERGHEVEVVVTADAPPAREDYAVHWVSRALPPGVRHAAALRAIVTYARNADVIYSTG